MGWFSRLFFRKKSRIITVVSGLPRSGTSMLMRMIEAGGIEALTDNQRMADEDNPNGYYEIERIKKIHEGDVDWLGSCEGKVIKIISALLVHLPESHRFQIVFVERNIDEVLLSQKKMLIRRGEDPDQVSDEKLASLFGAHLEQTYNWLEQHRHHITCLKISYNRLLEDGDPVIAEIDEFLGGGLDVKAMARVIDPALYRSGSSLQ